MSLEFFKALWRPLLGVAYVAIVIGDFLVFPAVYGPTWVPISLQENGFFHIAMGAVLGVTSWSRGQEKLAGKD